MDATVSNRMNTDVPPEGGATTQRFALVPNQTSVRFRTRHVIGLSRVEGSVDLRAGSALVNARDRSLLAVEAVLDMSSFASASAARDRVVASPRFLDSGDAERGRTAAEEIGARPLQLDITSDASVAAAVEQVRREAGHRDVLVNNAAVVGALDKTSEQVDADDLRVVHETNVLGLVQVTRAFLPLLQTSAAGVVVNVSSGMGSLSRTSDPEAMESRWPSLAYASLKAAVNMLTVQYAKAFPALRINAVDPGLTATDATGGMGKDVTEGVQAAVAMALIGADGPTATFSDADGPVPW